MKETCTSLLGRAAFIKRIKAGLQHKKSAITKNAMVMDKSALRTLLFIFTNLIGVTERVILLIALTFLTSTIQQSFVSYQSLRHISIVLNSAMITVFVFLSRKQLNAKMQRKHLKTFKQNMVRVSDTLCLKITTSPLTMLILQISYLSFNRLTRMDKEFTKDSINLGGSTKVRKITKKLK